MTEKVIRIRIPRNAPDRFLDDLIAAVQDAIRVISAQHYREKVDEEDIEIAVGQLYRVKHEAERHWQLPFLCASWVLVALKSCRFGAR